MCLLDGAVVEWLLYMRLFGFAMIAMTGCFERMLSWGVGCGKGRRMECVYTTRTLTMFLSLSLVGLRMAVEFEFGLGQALVY